MHAAQTPIVEHVRAMFRRMRGIVARWRAGGKQEPPSGVRQRGSHMPRITRPGHCHSQVNQCIAHLALAHAGLYSPWTSGQRCAVTTGSTRRDTVDSPLRRRTGGRRAFVASALPRCRTQPITSHSKVSFPRCVMRIVSLCVCAVLLNAPAAFAQFDSATVLGTSATRRIGVPARKCDDRRRNRHFHSQDFQAAEANTNSQP